MMKWILFLMAGVAASAAQAQQVVEWRKDKVTQIIFPAEIVKCRAGYTSDHALTQSDGQVLYIQPVMPQEETNLNVITSDGSYYAFDLRYNDAAQQVNYIIQPSTAFYQAAVSPAELADGVVGSSVPGKPECGEDVVPAEPDVQSLFSRVKEQGSFIVANNVAKLQKLTFLLGGVYVSRNHIFFRFRIENDSNVPFDVDYIAFSVTARKTKKTSSQERLQILPVNADTEVHRVDARSFREVVYCFDKFTIGKDKVLLAEVLEQGGDRNIGLKVLENFIIEARKL